MHASHAVAHAASEGGEEAARKNAQPARTKTLTGMPTWWPAVDIFLICDGANAGSFMILSAYPIPFFHAFSFLVTPASNWPAAALHAWLNQLRMVAGNVVDVNESQPFCALGSSSSKNAESASKQRWMALAWGISPPFTVGSQGACFMI